MAAYSWQVENYGSKGVIQCGLHPYTTTYSYMWLAFCGCHSRHKNLNSQNLSFSLLLLPHPLCVCMCVAHFSKELSDVKGPCILRLDIDSYEA